MLPKELDEAIGQDGDAILGPFTVAHNDLSLIEIHILDPQSQALDQAQAGAIKQLGDQLMRAGHRGEDLLSLFFRQDRRETFGLLGTDGVDRALQVFLEHVLVEEQQRAESLILRGSRDVPIHCQVGEVLLDLGRSHLLWVAFIVEEDEAPDPTDVGFLGASG